MLIPGSDGLVESRIPFPVSLPVPAELLTEAGYPYSFPILGPDACYRDAGVPGRSEFLFAYPGPALDPKNYPFQYPVRERTLPAKE